MMSARPEDTEDEKSPLQQQQTDYHTLSTDGGPERKSQTGCTCLLIAAAVLLGIVVGFLIGWFVQARTSMRDGGGTVLVDAQARLREEMNADNIRENLR